MGFQRGMPDPAAAYNKVLTDMISDARGAGGRIDHSRLAKTLTPGNAPVRYELRKLRPDIRADDEALVRQIIEDLARHPVRAWTDDPDNRVDQVSLERAVFDLRARELQKSH